MLDMLASFGKIHLFCEGSRPPDLRVCPSHLIVVEDSVRVVRDRSNALFPSNSVLANSPVQFGATVEVLSLLAQGAYMCGIDLQDCFLHGLVAPSRRRLLGVRRPVSGTLGFYLFLPF